VNYKLLVSLVSFLILVFGITSLIAIAELDNKTVLEINKEKSIAAGYCHSLVLDSNGSVWVQLLNRSSVVPK
jgi:alpha-tubulin suppressor-like RCC1 family protein